MTDRSRTARLRQQLAIPGRSALALFALITIALVGGLLLVMGTIEAERAQRTQVRRTNEILTELHNVGRAAINAETGQRGYFITLDRRYLVPYELGRAQYRPGLRHLKSLLLAGATPRQSALLTEIDKLATAKFAEMEESVGMIERGELIGAQRRILSDEGQEVMDRLRRAIQEMEDIEREILATATDNTAAAEARVLPLLGVTLALVVVALAFGLWQTARGARAEVAEAHAAELAEARDRADLLARELAHRVKNLFAMILAIVRMSARNRPEGKETADTIAERVQALLIAQEVTQGTHSRPVGDLATLVELTLAPYRSADADCMIEGPATALPDGKITPLGLVLHELATNAVKYGAWSHGGAVDVCWRHDAGGAQLRLDWVERCAKPCGPADREGFGSHLMHSAARQLQGSIDREFGEYGVKVHIAFPLKG